MYADLRYNSRIFPCTILGVGHTDLENSHLVSNEQFIGQFLSPSDRLELFKKFDPALKTLKSLSRSARREFIALGAKDFEESMGIKSRIIFPGPIHKLAAIAARKALEHAQLEATDIDLVLVGTNTPERQYPSTADELILELGACQNPFGFNMNEACTTGMAAVFTAAAMVRSFGFRVLVVMVDKATRLADRGYKRRNLFGDQAGAFILGPGQVNVFRFFAGGIDPFVGNINTIVQAKDGFEQDGAKVLAYMAKEVPKHLRSTFEKLGMNISAIDHWFPHTPSVRALDRLHARLLHLCPDFRATIHGDVARFGNSSCATTPWAISRAWHAGQLKTGDLIVATAFGAGMSLGSYGVVVS